MDDDSRHHLPPDTRMGHVRLRVSDLGRALDFYEGVLGYRAGPDQEGAVPLSPTGGPPHHFVLYEHPGAIPRPPRTTGLYHAAILLPGRRDLAAVVSRLSERGWPLDGASDHLVSEALYLSDPDGTGLEIYADRPRETWSWREGEIGMATLPLDFDGLMAELRSDPAPWDGVPEGATIGHVHLQVGDLGRAESFYCGLLGFEVTTRSYPGALFVSAGGYHHHIGLNVWSGRNVPPPPPESVGLVSYAIVLPDSASWESAIERLRDGGYEEIGQERNGGTGALFRDPAGNGVELWAQA